MIGTRATLLIDTGLGVANIKTVVDGLTALPVIVATTHIYWDHIGGHGLFENIAVYESEKDWLDGPLEIVKKNLTRKPCDFPADFHIENYHIYQGKPYRHNGD